MANGDVKWSLCVSLGRSNLFTKNKTISHKSVKVADVTEWPVNLSFFVSSPIEECKCHWTRKPLPTCVHTHSMYKHTSSIDHKLSQCRLCCVCPTGSSLLFTLYLNRKLQWKSKTEQNVTRYFHRQNLSTEPNMNKDTLLQITIITLSLIILMSQ